MTTLLSQPPNRRGRAAVTLDIITTMVEIAMGIQPCSVRALAYQLFNRKLIASMGKLDTQKVSRWCTIAREEGTLPWEWIVDPTRQEQVVATWADPVAYARAVQRSYRRNKWQAQTTHVSVWSEKGTVEGTLKPVDSGILAMALTAPFYTDRILGGNTEARIRVSAVFSSTGNNTMFSRELTRRIVPIDLVAPIENPSLRTGFKHNPLLDEFVAPRRRDLLVACLTICRHWIAEGRPAGSEVIGRYEAYAQTMGGILGSIGVEGFLANRKGLMGRNPQGTQWKALADAWKEKHNLGLVTAGDLWGTITGSSDLQVAFAEVLGDKSVLSQKQKLGKALEKQTNQVWGEWRITRSTAKPRNGSALYRLKPASEPFAEATDEDDEGEGEHATSCTAEDWNAF